MNAEHAAKPEHTILAELDGRERTTLSSSATLSSDGRRRHPEMMHDHRQNFAQDADRILHSRAYARYIDKTQVFSLVRNDHISHRALHVQLVARIARTIGRFLALNEDLIEAIALGHDIGHPPFGHAGESFLAELCRAHGLPGFQHNIQSYRILDRLERKGAGWNLCLQTLDGTLCHDGETHETRMRPGPTGDFTDLDAKAGEKAADPSHVLIPMSFEGCVVRMADTIAYIGRDIEDAIILGLLQRSDLPPHCTKLLGATNGAMVYTLVTDLIGASRIPRPGEGSGTETFIGFSDEIGAALGALKTFNYQRIYLAPRTTEQLPLIKRCYEDLFDHYLHHLSSGTSDRLSVDLLADLPASYLASQPPAARVRDFIAGMTDDYFLAQAKAIGCHVPEKR
jgi:dGTPase